MIEGASTPYFCDCGNRVIYTGILLYSYLNYGLICIMKCIRSSVKENKNPMNYYSRFTLSSISFKIFYAEKLRAQNT